MKYLKTLGVAMVAAAALMAFASSASANPVLTSPAGVEYTGHLEATLEKGTSLLLEAGFANVTCTESIVTGNVEKNNTTHAEGKITTLDFTACGETVVKTLALGSLTIDPSGTVTGSGSQVTVSIFGVSCVYGTTTGTDIGKLTGGTPATMDINATLPRISGGFLCANPAKWTGAYTVTKPGTLLLN